MFSILGSGTKAPATRSLLSVDLEVPEVLDTATFANGWFWTPDARFGLVDGVWRTRVGYAGGTTENPTYRSMGDHTECFQVDFDPEVVSYEDLLELFWQSHDPTQRAYKTQYASLVLTQGQSQAATAQESAARVERLFGMKLATRTEPLDTFWMAEDYHQKYYLRNDRLLMHEFRSAYPSEAELVASTAAARVNGLLYGGTCARLDRDLPGLDLSDEAAKHLRQHCR